MSFVQMQRFSAGGVLVELHHADISTPKEYRELIDPMDRLARIEGGSTCTVAEGAQRYIRSARADGPDGEQ